MDPEVLEEMVNSQENLRQITDERLQATENLGSLESKFESSTGETREELQEQKKQLEEQLQKTKQSEIKAAADFTTKNQSFISSLASKLGISPGDIDFQQPIQNWHPELRNFLADQTTQLIENVKTVQESTGESGKLIEKSPNTLKKIFNSIFEGHNPFIIMGVIGILSTLMNAGFTVADKINAFFSQTNKGLKDFSPIGCFQYHADSGSIRAVGVCGIDSYCSKFTESSTCGADKGPNKNIPEYCYWQPGVQGGKCIAGSAFTNGQQCCKFCSKDSDCISSGTPCSVPSDCMSGNCVKGMCQDQTCDMNSNTCTPCPSTNPKYPLLQQFQNGELAFCTGSAPSTTCPTASLLCRTTDNNGACEKCGDDILECKNPSGFMLEGTGCMCDVADGWTNLPVCPSPISIISSIVYMNSVKNQWVPSKTPLPIWILVGVGALMMLITLVWYVIYLVKHAKK